MKSLLFGADQHVALALFERHNFPNFSYDRAIGILDERQKLVGVCLLQNWNGSNIEFSYYGAGTLTVGIARALARYILTEFNVSRITVMISKKRKRYIKTVMRFGFRFEGSHRLYYGKIDNARNTAVRMVMFREQVVKLARVPKEEAA